MQYFPLVTNYLLFFSYFLGFFFRCWFDCCLLIEVVLFLLSWAYFLACTRLGVYTVIVAGWSSNSGYSLLGGLPSLAQTISYEVRLAGSVLILLASCQQTCKTYTIFVCTIKKILTMDRRTVRNM